MSHKRGYEHLRDRVDQATRLKWPHARRSPRAERGSLDPKELKRLRRDVPLFHVLYAIEEKAKEIEAIGALPKDVLPVRVLEGFGSWAALFVLRELAACGDERAKQWAEDLQRSRTNYRKPAPKGRRRG